MKLYLSLLRLLTAISLTIGLTGCGSGDKEAPETGSTPDKKPIPPTLVATTGMVADMVANVAGPEFEVVGMMGPGVDPHLYKTTPSDLSSLSRAKAVFYNGLLLEGTMGQLFDRMKTGGKPVFAVSSGLSPDSLVQSEEYEGHPDPHIWGDASLWAQCVDVVIEGLSKTFPDQQEGFNERGKAYQKEIQDLHQWARDRVNSLPEEKRILVTSHDAFNYTGKAYGLEVVGVQGISTQAEPSLAAVAQTVDFIKERKIKAIFVESSVSPDVIKRVSEDANVTIGGELFSDAMGIPGTMETFDGDTYDVGTYLGMLKHNINTAVSSLGKD